MRLSQTRRLRLQGHDPRRLVQSRQFGAVTIGQNPPRDLDQNPDRLGRSEPAAPQTDQKWPLVARLLGLPLLRDHGLDQLGQQGEGLLPSEIARFERNNVGNSFLHDAQIGPAGNLRE